ncbi:WD40-repeat-containing domain protein [Coemansia mojavensis]|nr:WD40-repeat-containing domain protein [Coemansia mojavensis]
MISAHTELIAVGCNSTSHALDWAGATVAYGAGNFIALYRPEEAVVHTTLRGHRERVNCVRFARGSQAVLVTGSVDRTARVWVERQPGSWQCAAELLGHAEAIEAVAGAVDESALTAVTAGTDGTIRVFQVDLNEGLDKQQPQQLEARQVIETGKHTALSLDLAQLDTAQLLCAGSTDSHVHVFVQRDGVFDRAARLAGHAGWTAAVAAAQAGARDTTQGATAHWRAGDVIVASGSHDRMVRLWRISRTREAQATGLRAQLDAAARGDELALQEQTFCVAGRLYAAAADAVLAGHEGRVHGVRWRDGRLASASADGSAMVWAAQSVWQPQARLGDANGRQALLGVAWGADSLAAYGIRGSLHAWQQQGARWEPRAAPSGHAAGVQDVCWEPQGRYVLSVGLDQTARLFAQWRGARWHEAARPQTHGHDMRRAAFVTPTAYVAAADEKVARVLAATRQFAGLSAFWEGADVELPAGALAGAAQPELGLSNRAAGPAHGAVDAAAAADAAAAPTEEQLQRRLWPEAEKLYGHPNDVLAVAASHDGRWVASSCRAARPPHAAIRIVATDSWQPPCAPLAVHALSVTALRFSPDDRLLLSAGRDRSWALFALSASGAFRLLHHRPAAHARIVWDVAWAPDAAFFATASRDKSVRLWAAASPAAEPVVLAFPEPVTAVDMAQRQGVLLLAAALESGRTFVLRAQGSGSPPRSWAPSEISPLLMHAAPVRRVAWQPGASWLLASASDDHTVRLTRISLP